LINRIALAEYRFLYCSSKVITQDLRQNYHSDLIDITFTKIRQQINTAKSRRLIKIEKCLRSHLHSITPSLRIFSNGSLVSIGSPITALIQLRISIFCSASASFVNVHQLYGIASLYRDPKKRHHTRGGNSVNSQMIFNLFSRSDSLVNLQHRFYYRYHRTSWASLQYLVKH